MASDRKSRGNKPGFGIDFDLSACLDGDKRAWDAFVASFARVIYAAVLRTMRTRWPAVAEQDVQDATQEVFLRLVRNDYRLLRRFDPTRASLATWLTLVARSTAIDRLRARQPQMASLDDPHVAEPADAPPADPLMSMHIPPGLLTERQRLLLHLLVDRQMTVRQAAEFLGIDAQTVRSARHKAVQRLREHFGRQRPVEPEQ